MMKEELEADICIDIYYGGLMGECEDCARVLRRGDEFVIRGCYQAEKYPARHRAAVRIDGPCQDCTLLCANCDEERSVKAQERAFHAHWEG